VTRLGPLSVLVAALLAGCYGPSVPVPPPAPEAMSFSVDVEAGTATYQASLGSEWGDCWVTVQVERTRDGVVTKSALDGRVGPTRPFLAAPGDQAVVLIDCLERASGLCLIVGEGQASSASECP
jgi:hypothetical protein